jgi:uncharacterized protein (TIGR00730 family)
MGKTFRSQGYRELQSKGLRIITMESTPNQIHDQRLADAWAELQAHAVRAIPSTAMRTAWRLPTRNSCCGARPAASAFSSKCSNQTWPSRPRAWTVLWWSLAAPGSRLLEQADAAMAQARSLGDAKAMALAERGLRNAAHYEQARQFARLVAAWSAAQPHPERLFICTGGGPGIMEAANRGAQDAGMPSVALNIALPHEQQANPYVTPELSFKFHYFALRKMHFMMRAVALVAFPGGFGTLDELFEVITLVQTRKAKPVPIILFGSAYWKRLMNFDALIEEGAISPEDLDLITYADAPADAWEVIRRFYALG